MVPNGSLEIYYKVSNAHVIGHVLVGQNRGSTSVYQESVLVLVGCLWP